MASQDILNLVRQGDPQTIADLLNRSFRPRGITAYVLRQGDRLHITLESPQSFNREVATTFIHKRLQSLNIEPIKSLVIDGQPAGQEAIAWQQEVELQPHQNPSPSSTMQESSFSPPSLGDDPATTHVPLDRSAPPPTDSAAPPTMMNSEDIALPLGSETAPVAEATVTVDLLETTAADHAETAEVVSDVTSEAVSEVTSDVLDSSSAVAGEIPSEIPSEIASEIPSDVADSLAPVETAIAAIVASPSEPPAGAVATTASPSSSPSKSTSASETDILQRPEAAILLVFAVLVLLWDLYLELAEDINATTPLSGRSLARRLGVASSTLGRRRDRPDFDRWTQDLDPDGVAWTYQDGQYVPKVI
ncbi:MAG TPA: hypothetical protein V6C88_15040 [Chroococcidiopsis sp.]